MCVLAYLDFFPEGLVDGGDLSFVVLLFICCLLMMKGGRIAMLGIPSESFPVNWDRVVLKVATAPTPFPLILISRVS